VNLITEIREVARAIPATIEKWLNPPLPPAEVTARKMLRAARLDEDALWPTVLYNAKLLNRSVDDVALAVIKREIGNPRATRLIQDPDDHP